MNRPGRSLTDNARVFAAVFCVMFVSMFSPANADDWTQWRGNNRDGKWNETGVVDRLTNDNLDIVWRQPIGSGYSGPTVASGRVFVMDRNEAPKQTESVRCFDAKTGTPTWELTYDAVYTVSYSAGPRASVTIDGERAYALGTMGNLHCIDVADGNVVWKRNLDQEYKISESNRMPIWGIAASPLVHGDLLILQIGAAEGACVVALDKTTGVEVWRSLDDRGQYSSPIIFKQNENEILICWTGDAIAGLNPADGTVHWHHPFKPSRMPIGVATPIIKDNQIFVTSFYDGSMMVKMGDDGMSVAEVWAAKGPNEKKTEALHSIISTPIWIDDHIYGVDSHGELRCLNAEDGTRVWENTDAVQRNRWGTIHFVEHNKEVWMFNDQGELLIGKLSPAGLEEFSRVELIKPTQPQLPNRRGGVTWSHPAFANKSIYVRNDEELICIDVAKP